MNQPNQPDEPHRSLEYASPPLSPWDRPVEPVVAFARMFRLIVRILYVLFALLVIGVAVFGALKMRNVLDEAGGQQQGAAP